MAITRYSQVAIEQIPFGNLPGGGPILMGTPGPFGLTPQFNDPGIEIGNVREVTAIYQMYGNEVANDVANIYLAQPGTMVTPTGNVSGSGIAGTATINLGDDDTTGYGLVSNPAGTGTTKGADPSRYASALNVATGQTNPIRFAGGTALVDPYVIGATAVEPPTNPLTPGAGIAGSWVYATFATLITPVGGKVLVFRLTVVKP